MTSWEASEPRDEHLAWCKQRALVYVDRGDLQNAFASMASDLRKHELTENHAGAQIGIMMLLGGQLDTAHDMRKWIEGFH